jgi:hypothetical protein
MLRVWLALFAAPVLVGLVFGSVAVIVAPFTVVATLAIGAPLFYLFKRLGWLTVWHAIAVGGLCGTLLGIAWGYAVSPWHTDAFGIADTLVFCAAGVATALLFWGLGVFRNPELPAAPKSWPWSLLLLVPLVVAGVRLHQFFDAEFYIARIISVSGSPTEPTERAQLLDGTLRSIDPWADALSSSDLYACGYFMRHWSNARWKKIDSLESRLTPEDPRCPPMPTPPNQTY